MVFSITSKYVGKIIQNNILPSVTAFMDPPKQKVSSSTKLFFRSYSEQGSSSFKSGLQFLENRVTDLHGRTSLAIQSLEEELRVLNQELKLMNKTIHSKPDGKDLKWLFDKSQEHTEAKQSTLQERLNRTFDRLEAENQKLESEIDALRRHIDQSVKEQAKSFQKEIEGLESQVDEFEKSRYQDNRALILGVITCALIYAYDQHQREKKDEKGDLERDQKLSEEIHSLKETIEELKLENRLEPKDDPENRLLT